MKIINWHNFCVHFRYFLLIYTISCVTFSCFKNVTKFSLLKPDMYSGNFNLSLNEKIK